MPGMGYPPMGFRSAKTVNKAHGRLEERTLTVSSLMNDYLDWPYLGQVFKLERASPSRPAGLGTAKSNMD